MKPNTRISADLEDNSDRFSDPFFQRFELRQSPQPLELKSGITKAYSFPTFYGDVTSAIAIFLCDYQRAESMMPHPSMKPMKMPRGRSVVLFSCVEYKNVMNISPYNEVVMTLPVMVGGGANPPVLPLVKDFKNKGYYVFSMPVTSLENQIRGREIWGLPKVLEEIEITVDDTCCSTIVRDERGAAYFELSVPTTGKHKHFDETGYLYSVKDGELLKSRNDFKGDFEISTDFSLLWRKNRKIPNPVLRLGTSARADVLRKLRIEEAPFQFRFAASMSSCFDLPLENW